MHILKLSRGWVNLDNLAHAFVIDTPGDNHKGDVVLVMTAVEVTDVGADSWATDGYHVRLTGPDVPTIAKELDELHNVR